MSFLKDLEKLHKTAPVLPDTEDTQNEDRATVYQEADEDDDVRDQLSRGAGDSSKLRKRFGVAELSGPRYEGKKVSAKDVFDLEAQPRDLPEQEEEDENEVSGSEEDSDEEEEDGDDEEEEDDDDDNEDGENFEDEDESIGDDELSKDASRLELDDEVGGSDGEEVTDDEEEDDDSDVEEEEEVEEEEDAPAVMDTVSNKQQNKKAVSVRRQLAIFDQLLYTKIKLHAAMRAYNELPRGKLAQQLLKSADEETKKNYKIACQNARKLVVTLLDTQDILLAGCAQTASLLKGGKEKGSEDEGDSDDEEITSDESEGEEDDTKKKVKKSVKNGESADGEGEDGEDEEGDDEEEDENDDEEPIPDYNFGSDYESDGGESSDGSVMSGEGGEKKETNGNISNQKFSGIAARLAKSDKRFEKFRRATIKKWDDRTRLTGTQARRRGGDQRMDGALAQIDKVLNDKVRLVRRTQTKRSDVDRIGGNEEETEDPETFDDNDFYQMILKDLFEKKNSELIDPVAMTKQWMQLQKLRDRRTKKKNVDTKASKGRKLRYMKIPKLVAFHPANGARVPWTHESRNELFKSLFA